MGLINETIEYIEKRRENLLNGGVNCIPSPFQSFKQDFVGIEQETYYCPHVCSADYADGWYDKLEAMQGKQNTYYAGEILGFGDMEDTCAASKDIITRFF